MGRDEGHNKVHEQADHWSAITPLDVWHQGGAAVSGGRSWSSSTRRFMDFEEHKHKDFGLFHLWAPPHATTRVDVRCRPCAAEIRMEIRR